MRYLQLLFVLVVWTGFSGGACGQDLLEQARALKDTRKCPEALPLFALAWEGRADAATAAWQTDCLYGWAECLLATGRTDTALSIFEQVVRVGRLVADHEKVMYAYSVLGEVHRMRGMHRRSLEYNLQCAYFCRLTGNESKYSSRLSIIGNNYLGLAMPDSAYWYTREAVRIKEAIGDTALLSLAYDYLGAFHRQQGALGKAAEAYLNATAAAEQAGNHFQLGNALISLSEVLVADGHPDKAKTYAERALALCEEQQLPLAKARTYNVLADVAIAAGRPSEAVPHLRAALAVYLERRKQQQLAQQYLRLARLHLDLRRYPEAGNYLSAGKEIAARLENIALQQDFRLTEGKWLAARQKPEQAEKALEEVLAASAHNHDTLLRLQALSELAKVAEQQGAFQKANAYLREMSELEDSLNARRQSRFLQQLEARYRRSEQDAEIARLNLENELADVRYQTARSRQNMLYVAVFLALFTAVSGFFLFFQKQKNAALLLEKNKTIEKTLAEKELLLREIHHRVKNNLQVVSSLLSLQSKYIKDPTAVSAVTNSRTRVRSMALIHQNLYQADNLMSVRVRGYFTRLLAELFDTYNIDPEKIALRMDIDDLQLDVDSIIPIGLIINELVSNSLKYAFPGGRAGWVEICLQREKEGLRLEVSDSGPGFDPGAFANSASFGFKLVNAFAQKLEAKTELIRSEGRNTVRLTIPSDQIQTSL